MGKPPAFQFYPMDFMQGAKYMTLPERGAYISLLCEQWDLGSVSSEPGDLMKVLGCGRKEAAKIWAGKVGSKFERGDDGRYRNERLEEERRKQAEYRALQSNRGRKGGRPKKAGEKPDESRGLTAVKPVPKPDESPRGKSPSSSSSFSSSGEPLESAVLTRRGSLVVSPLEFDRIHGKHVTGFCDWCCFPQFLAETFANSADWTEAQVVEWAEGVRRGWQGPRGDELKFWRARWDERHPQKPKTVGSKNSDVLQRFVERHS